MDRRVWIVFLIIFTNMLGVGIIFPFLHYYAEHFGASYVVVGLLSAMFPLFQIISAPFLGTMADSKGRRPVLLISVFGTALGFLVLGLANSLPLLFLARIIDGITAGNTPTATAYISDITSEKDRSHAMGILSAAFSSGMIVGPLVGGALVPFGYEYPAFAAAIIAFVSFLCVYFLLPESKTASSRPVKKQSFYGLGAYFSAFKEPIIIQLLSITFFVFMASWLFDGTFALYIEHGLHLPHLYAGIFFTYWAVVAIIVQLTGIKLLKKYFSDKLLLFYQIIILTLGFILLLLSSNLVLLVLATTLIAVSIGIINPLIPSLLSQATSDNNQGKMMSVWQSVDSIATLAGPIIGTFLFGIFFTLPYVVAMLFCLSAFSVAFRLKR